MESDKMYRHVFFCKKNINCFSKSSDIIASSPKTTCKNRTSYPNKYEYINLS